MEEHCQAGVLRAIAAGEQNFEYDDRTGGGWKPCGHSHEALSWIIKNCAVRVAPRYIKVGKLAFPRPITEVPEIGDTVFFVKMALGRLAVIKEVWCDSSEQRTCLKNNRAHLNPNWALQHAEVLSAISRGEF